VEHGESQSKRQVTTPHRRRTTWLFRFDGGWPGQDDDDGSAVWRAVAVEGPSGSPIARPPIPEYRDPRERIAEAMQRDEEAAQADGDEHDPATSS
jgi:hypothetical protein